MKIRFEAGEGRHFAGSVNYMISEDRMIYAECPVPDGAAEDYGYFALKRDIVCEYHCSEPLFFLYDGQEQFLSEDAKANCETYIHIERGDTMKQISFDNGHTYMTAEEAINWMCEREAEEKGSFSRWWDVVTNAMNDDVREIVCEELAPCTEREFLTRYLELEDLIVG